MDYLLISIYISIAILVVLGSGMYVSTGLALIGILGYKLIIGRDMVIGTILYNSASSFVLSAIPLYIFMGEIVQRTKISQSLYRGISNWVAPIHGKLLHANVISCAFFAAISGSAVATAAAIGSMAFPEQLKRRYPTRLIAGTLAAGGTVGILIPPSSTMIIYGAMTGESVGKLFIAGILPGILMTFLFSLYVFFASSISKEESIKAEKVNKKEYFINFFIAFKYIWPILLIVATIFIGIYGGFITPTEAGALSAFEAMLIALLFKRLNLNILKEAALSTLKTTGMIFFIIICASILGNFVSLMRLPALLTNAIADSGLDKYTVLAYVVGVYIILGCLLEATAIIVLTVPITYSLLVKTLGFNPLWVGVLIVIVNQVALITPPVGLNVFVIHGISGIEDIGEIFKGILPYIFLMIIVIIVMVLFPEIVTFLPNQMN